MELNGGPEVAPFVITYRQVFRRPKIEITRKFVGVRKLILNVVQKLRETVEELAYDVERNVVDPGESRAVHWAINVRDPWEAGSEADLVAIQIPGMKPPAGYHFEVIQMLNKPEPTTMPRNGVRHTPATGAAAAIRESMRDVDSELGA